MSIKLPLPNQAGLPNANNLTNEANKLKELYDTVNRSISGEYHFTSTSSNITYSTDDFPANANIYNRGQDGMIYYLGTVVIPNYGTSVDDWNNLLNTIDLMSSENILSQYKKNVTVVDANNNPTTVEYLRKSDDTLANKRVASNADANGFYQTVIEEFYEADGTTVYKTITYTYTFLENGIIDTSDYVVS